MRDLTRDELCDELCRRCEADWSLQHDIYIYAGAAWDVMHGIPVSKCENCIYFKMRFPDRREGYCTNENSPYKKRYSFEGGCGGYYKLNPKYIEE